MTLYGLVHTLLICSAHSNEQSALLLHNLNLLIIFCINTDNNRLTFIYRFLFKLSMVPKTFQNLFYSNSVTTSLSTNILNFLYFPAGHP